MKISMMKSSTTTILLLNLLSLFMPIPGLEDRVLEEPDGEPNQDTIGKILIGLE